TGFFFGIGTYVLLMTVLFDLEKDSGTPPRWVTAIILVSIVAVALVAIVFTLRWLNALPGKLSGLVFGINLGLLWTGALVALVVALLWLTIGNGNHGGFFID
ncbi:MAG TPA: hypothetical protein VKR05_07025, partial [Candidatus Cybelea sp.]|nr:hypothetical protein [Candidatus Cybelea sp.]